MSRPKSFSFDNFKFISWQPAEPRVTVWAAHFAQQPRLCITLADKGHDVIKVMFLLYDETWAKSTDAVFSAPACVRLCFNCNNLVVHLKTVFALELLALPTPLILPDSLHRCQPIFFGRIWQFGSFSLLLTCCLAYSYQRLR